MSWNIMLRGTRDAVIIRLGEREKELLKLYGGKPEGDDIQVCVKRAIDLVQAMDLTTDAYGSWNAVEVNAAGSHGWTDTEARKLLSSSFSLAVTRIHLDL